MTKGELAFLALKQWCEKNGVPTPVPEHCFHPKRKFRFDASWVDYKVGLDIQGQIWHKGGHSSGGGITKDCEKISLAAVEGWRVLLCTYEQFNSGKVFKWIAELFSKELNSPQD